MRNRIVKVIAIAAIAMTTIAGPASAADSMKSPPPKGGGGTTHASQWR